MRVLVTWFGLADMRAARKEPDAGLGPVAQVLEQRPFDHVVLLTNHKKADIDAVRAFLDGRGTKPPLHVREVQLRSPTDFSDIYKAATGALAWVRKELGDSAKLTFHLSPGTPAMATIWILLASRYGAELLQSSKEAGVQSANIPFEIAAEFVPDLVRRGDAELERVGARPEDPSFKDILGRSEPMKRLVDRASNAAPFNAAVLIEGESGTGKELLAAAIHKASGRKGAFVAVNCGALPKELVESAFFGHRKGAFTGAVAQEAGYFEQAHHGTLFLDEVGELPLDAQVKLLRALQEKKVRRVGGGAEMPIDVRVVAATNRDLLSEVGAGRFREDLYYRLAVLVLRTPPLREREGDLLLLLDHELGRLNADRAAKDQKKLSPTAKKLLLAHAWPGNVRELQATLVRAFVWSPGATIEAKTVEEALVRRAAPRPDDVLNRPLGNGLSLEDCLSEVARHYLERAWNESGGKKKKAAELVGLPSYQRLTYWMQKYGVKV